MISLKQFLRRTRTLLWTALSILIIFAATLMGVGKLLMPYSDRYQPQLEAWLSEEFGQQVTLESFSGEWNAFGPRLSLKGMRLREAADGSGGASIAEAAVDLKPLNLLIPGKALYSFLVIGADFQLVRSAQGEFQLSGLGVGGKGAEGVSAWRNLLGIGQLILEESSLEYSDESNHMQLSFSAIDARLQLKDDEISINMQTSLQEGKSGTVFGELDATGLLTLTKGGRAQEVRWQVSTRELILASLRGRLPENPYLPREGRVNARLWGNWATGQPLVARGVLDLKNARLEFGDQELSLDHLNTRFGWSFGGKSDWRVDLHELTYDDGVSQWSTAGIALARDVQNNLGLWISAGHLPLDLTLSWAQNLLSGFQTDWLEFLPGMAGGEVNDLELVLDGNWKLKLAAGWASDVHLSGWAAWPSFSGLSGKFDFGPDYGSLNLRAEVLAINWPRMFKQSLSFALPDCPVDLQWGDRWQVALQNCSLMNEDIEMSGDVLVSGNGGRPAVDINLGVPHGNIGHLSPYWPQVISENVRNWLDRGLQGGVISGGRLQIHGDLDDWPFNNGEGRFESVAWVQDALLDYVPGWPPALGVDAVARFHGGRMDVEGTIGDIAGVPVQRATAVIRNLQAPLLEVSYESQAELEGFLRFVTESPLQQQLGTDLSRFSFSGPASTSGSLQFPLGNVGGAPRVDGNLQLAGSEFVDPASKVTLTGIKGAVHYSQETMRGTGIQARFKGKPALLDVAANKAGTERFRADLSGDFDVRDIVPEFLQDSKLGLNRIQGASDWTVSVVVPAAAGGLESPAELIVQSDLLGVGLDFPAPLNKLPGDIWPLEFHYPLTGASRLLTLQMDSDLFLQLELPESPETFTPAGSITRALIRLGHGSAELPPPGFLRIEGETDELNLDQWMGLVRQGSGGDSGFGGLELEQCEITARRLYFLDRRFDEVGLAVNRVAGDIRARFSARDIDGYVVFSPAPGNGSLTAEFERLVLSKPVGGGLEMKTNPAGLPALHLFAKSFRYAGLEMGQTRVEAFPTAGGLHFETVETESEELEMRATGDWLVQELGQRSDFKIMLTAESLGKFLESMDINSSLEGGQTLLHFSAWWPGSPGAFALSRLNGEIEFSVSRGQISNASPGSGRLLGLLSIQALPRRLALDFRDVFDSGFAFEEAHGTFLMKNGTASTNDVSLTSSAANISLSGNTDLVGQRYDQLMIVQPGLGNTLPIIGAIAGGPGGAAAGLALQGLLHKQLGQATQVQYTITGSWDEPLIEPVLTSETDG